MYTRCPECNTYFRVTAENLRVANGEVCCGACETEFNALAALVDIVPDQLVDDNSRDAIPDKISDNNRRGVVPDQLDDDIRRDGIPDQLVDDDRRDENPAGVDRLEHETWDQDEWHALLDRAPDAPADDDDESEPISMDESEIYGEIIVLESGPEDAEPDSSDEIPDDSEDSDHEEPEEAELIIAEQSQYIEREFRRVSDDEPEEDSVDFHRWLAGDLEADDTPDAGPEPSRRGWFIVVSILLLTLLSQLLHYNRDSFAADSKYGHVVRGLYSGLGSTLYPEWELSSFEVRGTEAVAGDTASSALNILANVLVVSDQPVGMPMIRVVLHDRWSAPVASGVFQPGEYLSAQSSRPDVLEPGTTLPIKISVADPGSEARGYIVDICLPRRSTGLQCQLAKDPFRP